MVRLSQIKGDLNFTASSGFTHPLIMPTVPRRAGTQLDVPGAIVLFTGLLCLIGPLLFGHDLHWAPWVWVMMAAGAAIVAAFLRLERIVACRGGMPLIDLALLSDAAFMRGLCAAFCFFFANLSFFFGHGQGLVMAPLSGAVLSTVKPASAGSGAGMYGTTSQVANAAGVAAIGAVFFATATVFSARLALFAALTLFALSIAICAAFLAWMRHAPAHKT